MTSAHHDQESFEKQPITTEPSAEFQPSVKDYSELALRSLRELQEYNDQLLREQKLLSQMARRQLGLFI